MTREARVERVKRERFMPFRFESTAIRMVPEALFVDEVAVPLEHEEEALARGELRLEGEGWTVVRLRLSLTVDGDIVHRVLPEGERLVPPVRWVVVLDAPETRLRRVQGTYWVGPECAFDLEIDSADVLGAVTITPWLVRARPSETKSAVGFGQAEGHRLASGRAFVLHPNPVPLRSGQFLDVRFKAFAEDAALKTAPRRLYHLDTVEEPILWINSDHASIADVLNAKGQTGLSARLREVSFDLISIGVWTQLFFLSVETLSAEGESRRPWQAGVLAELLPHMLPGLPTHSARVRELLAIRGEGSLGQLAELCDGALQRRVDVVKHISRLIEHSRAGS